MSEVSESIELATLDKEMAEEKVSVENFFLFFAVYQNIVSAVKCAEPYTVLKLSVIVCLVIDINCFACCIFAKIVFCL
jgi:hypothetical protein